MQKTKKVGLGQNDPKSKLFYTLLIILPILQFLVFWVYVNFNSIMLAFKVFDENAATAREFHWGIKNFLYWFNTDKYSVNLPDYTMNIGAALKLTLKTYGLSLIITWPLGLFFSYYIFKKMPGSKWFRIMLFLPSIISAAPMSIIFKDLTMNVIGKQDKGLWGFVGEGWFNFDFWGKKGHPYFSMVFFNFFIGFGTGVLMYTNKMDSIPPEIIESAHLDGANGIKEFWYIVLPQAFSIIQVFLITGFAGAFTNQYNAFTLFSWSPNEKVTSLGLLLWNGVRKANDQVWKMAPFAALGLIITIVVVPMTFFLKWAINKFGWKEE